MTDDSPIISTKRHQRRVWRVERAIRARAERHRPLTLRLHGYVSKRAEEEAQALRRAPVPATVTVTVARAWHAQTERFTVLGLVTEGGEVIPKAYNLCKASRVCVLRGTPAEHADALT